MCDYKDKCPGVNLRNDNSICFGTPTGCEIYPVMEELNTLRNDKKDYEEEKGNFLCAMKKYEKIINKCKEILKPIIDKHEEISKLEQELENIDLDKS